MNLRVKNLNYYGTNIFSVTKLIFWSFVWLFTLHSILIHRDYKNKIKSFFLIHIILFRIQLIKKRKFIHKIKHKFY
jgi:hypothetical protein